MTRVLVGRLNFTYSPSSLYLGILTVGFQICMSKKIILVLVLAILLILTLGFFIFKDNQATSLMVSDVNNTATSTYDVKPTELKGKGSLNSLLSRGENLECSITYQNATASDSEINGSYFVSQNRMRGDFIVMDNGKQMVSSMITKDNMMYNWSEIDGQKFGMKVDMTELKKAEASTTPDTHEPVPTDADVQYECKPWNNVDGSIFEPPTDIIFRDFSNVMNTGMEYGNIYEGEEMDMEAMMKDLQTR